VQRNHRNLHLLNQIHDIWRRHLAVTRRGIFVILSLCNFNRYWLSTFNSLNEKNNAKHCVETDHSIHHKDIHNDFVLFAVVAWIQNKTFLREWQVPKIGKQNKCPNKFSKRPHRRRTNRNTFAAFTFYNEPQCPPQKCPFSWRGSWVLGPICTWLRRPT